jgi:hypothetical protein
VEPFKTKAGKTAPVDRKTVGKALIKAAIKPVVKPKKNQKKGSTIVDIELQNFLVKREPLLKKDFYV